MVWASAESNKMFEVGLILYLLFAFHYLQIIKTTK